MLTQRGLRLSLKRLREPDAIGLLEARGVPAAWRNSIVEADRRPSSAATPAWRRASNSPATARHRRALQGRIADAALGRDRSRPTGLAADQPLARPLRRRRQAPRPQPRQVCRRAQGPDRRLARPRAQRALQAEPPARRRHACLGKLLDVSGRLTALHGIEKPRQLPRTLCDAPSAEREMSTPTSPNGSTRPATVTGPDHKAHPDGRPP